MDGDEFFCGLVAALVAAVVWIPWYRALARVSPLGRRRARTGTLALWPLLCLGLLFVVLIRWADPQVTNDPGYIVLFLLVGAALLGLTLLFLPFFGVSTRDDVIQAANPAAAVVTRGALLGITLCFAGANIGTGPTIWTTIGPALLAIGSLFATWFVLDRLVHVSDAVALDRDLAAGWRVAGLLVGGGLVLGRAVAGDWVSAGDTLYDFCARGWPVLALAAVTALAQLRLRPTLELALVPVVVRGALVAAAFVAVAAAWAAMPLVP